MSGTIIDDVDELGAPEPPREHTRRGVLGRLYHGETSIDFYGKRWWGLGFSAVLVVVTVVSLIISGLNLSIDFEGGVSWSVRSESLTEERAREILDDHGVDGSSAKIRILTTNEGVRTIEVQVGDQPDEVRREVQDAYAEEVGLQADDITTSSVSSTWGDTITQKAIKALVVFMVLVAAFIAWRLEWRMAIAAIIAMVHDVLISIGVYSVLGFEVTPATVVAFLTILGFSLYDTIVVFDKVKENQGRYSGSRVPYADVVNVSMNQVLMRSLNTSLAAVLPVLSLLVIGSGLVGAVTLREFALALLVGLLTGSYSSIFIASPIVAMLKEREPRYRALRNRHATGAELERLVLGGAPSTRRDGTKRARAESGKPATAEAPLPAATPTEVLTHTPRPRKKKRRP
ncbi:MAG TPA: protein translocase subunit SecF [Ilumatobacteraceae bacterium]|nr:protein translocase subunit SecF [Ilumatobacteraceae bacterium]